MNTLIRSSESSLLYKHFCHGISDIRVGTYKKFYLPSKCPDFVCLLDGQNPCLGPSSNLIECRDKYNKFAQWKLGMWADPGGTAMPGQPVTEPEQAPELYPLTKISLISKGAHGPRIIKQLKSKRIYFLTFLTKN